MMAGELLVEVRGALGVLTLKNPGKRNALDPGMCAALTRALAELPGQGVRALLLSGDPAGKAFCAGFDLDALAAAQADPEAGDRVFEALLEAMAACPLPIVAALGGAAIGGGCELAAACDFRVAHAEVKLGLPPARLGIVYATRGLARFSAICGESRARQLFLLARTIDGSEAQAWGLVDFLVAAGEVAAQAESVATQLAELAPLAVQGMRVSFEALLRRRCELEGAAAAEIARQRAAAWRSADAQEGRAAIAERRQPRFRGA